MHMPLPIYLHTDMQEGTFRKHETDSGFNGLVILVNIILDINKLTKYLRTAQVWER